MIKNLLEFRKKIGELNLLVHEFVNAKDMDYLDLCLQSIMECVDDIYKYKRNRMVMGVIEDDKKS